MAAGASLLPMKVPSVDPGRSQASDVAAVSPENPAQESAQDQWMQLDLSKEDIDQSVKIVSMYRNQWGTDRLLRSKDWMRSVLFYRGIQVIDWNPDSSSWVDALSWYEGGGYG